MASSKNMLLLLGALLVFILLVSSEVSASHEGESMELTGERGDQGGVLNGGDGYYGGGGGRGRCRYGCCRGFRFRYGCKRCCATAEESPDAQFEDDVKN